MGIKGRVLAALVCLAAAAVFAGCGSGGGSDRDGRIAFTSGSNIDVVNGDGTNQQVLVTNASQPSVSRDGNVAVFVRENNIYALNTKNHIETQVTNVGTGVNVSAPEINPQGTQVAYVSTPVTPGGIPNLRLVDIDGLNDHLLVANGDYPAFNRNGTRVAFIRDNNIYTIDIAGGAETQVTDLTGETLAGHPVYSSNGNLIYYTSQATPGGVSTVMSVPAVGGTSTTVFSDASDLAANPVGDEFAFVRNGRIYKSNLDGTNATPLTMGPDDSGPSWSE